MIDLFFIILDLDLFGGALEIIVVFGDGKDTVDDGNKRRLRAQPNIFNWNGLKGLFFDFRECLFIVKELFYPKKANQI